VNHNVKPCAFVLRSLLRATRRESYLISGKTKRARFRGKRGPICVARAVYNLVEHHPMPATTAPQPRPLPEGKDTSFDRPDNNKWRCWCAIMILLFTRDVPPCQPYSRVVDKDWARRLVTSHAAYPFASPAPPSPPVAWGEPEAYAKVTSRAQHLESIADADPPGRPSCFRDARSSGASVRPTIRSDNDVPTIRFLDAPAPRPAEGRMEQGVLTLLGDAGIRIRPGARG